MASKAVDSHVTEPAIAEVSPDLPAQHLYRHGFFDPYMRRHWPKLVRTLILPVCLDAVLILGCLSMYWATLQQNNQLGRLTVAVVDLDRGLLGNQVVQGLKTLTSSPINTLQWIFEDSVASDAQSQAWVLDERYWAVLQVSPNATASLNESLSNGISFYSPMGALTLYFASARQEMTVNSLVVPSVMAALTPILNVAGAASAAMFIERAQGNVSVLRNAQACPQCLVTPFAVQQVDLLPFSTPAAVGSVTIGLIYLLTFAFSAFQNLRNTGVAIGCMLNIRSTILFRTTNTLLVYLLLSLAYALVNLAFGVPLGTVYGAGGGFFVFWMLSAFTMAACGLPMEAVFALVGIRWAPFLMNVWLIVNVSGAFTSFELMPGFFKFGYATPFFNCIQGTRTILFGERSHLGLNFGVLVAWTVIGWFGLCLTTLQFIRRNRRKGLHALR